MMRILFTRVLVVIFLPLLPLFARAGGSSDGMIKRPYRQLIDTVPVQTPPTVDPKKETPKTVIKEVPKSRRQSRPLVVKPKIQPAPVRIIKPKIIRRTGIL